MRKNYFLLVTLAFLPLFARGADLCSTWQYIEPVGSLNTQIIPEASGLAISATYLDRLYHTNDSGDGPYFYTTDTHGSFQQKVEIANFNPYDSEELAMAPCLGKPACLFIGDIGDNAKVRNKIRIVLIEEKASFPAKVNPLAIFDLRYPDGAHNAEAMSVHPNGDLFIFTKETNSKPTQIYKLPAAELNRPGPDVRTLVYMGMLDIPSLLNGFSEWGKMITSMAIARDGKRILLLTYESVLEMNLDLTTSLPAASTLVEGQDYAILRVPELSQQEAIAWLPEENGFLYSTEAENGAPTAPLIKVLCGKSVFKK